MQPKISFLMATKNRAEYIKDTLNSLIKQDISDWEVIIVDDHGRDETPEIVESMRDDRLRYFRLLDSHGFGVGCARNFAAIQARADLVAIADSDDINYPNRATVTLEAFRETPDADVFYANIDVWEMAKNIVRDRKTPFTPYSLELIKEKNFIPNVTLALKKKILIENPYNSFFRVVEDYELLSRLASLDKKFIYKDIKLVKYRLGQQNISIGKEKINLVNKYGLLAKMLRGWIPFENNILKEIEIIEKGTNRG